MPKLWDTEDIKTLTDGYAKGLCTKTIATLVGKSKRSCIGKAYRLGLQHPTFAGVRKWKPKKKKKEPDMIAIAVIETGPIGEYTFEQIACKPMCHYPMSHGTWCGRSIKGGAGVYCCTHAGMVYRPTPGKRLFEDAA